MPAIRPRLRRVTHVVMHTSASYNERLGVIYPDAQAIDAMHREKGWNEIGYHYVVTKTGKVETGRPVWKPGAHVAGFNATTIGVCVSGHGDHKAWTPEQWRGAVSLVAELCRRHGLAETVKKNPMRVLGHGEVGKMRQTLARMIGVGSIPDPKKSCPGRLVDMAAFRSDVAAMLEARP